MPSQPAKARAEGLVARGFDESKLDGERSFYARLESEVLGGDQDSLITWMLAERERLFPDSLCESCGKSGSSGARFCDECNRAGLSAEDSDV